jgi:hypothetical protein
VPMHKVCQWLVLCLALVQASCLLQSEGGATSTAANVTSETGVAARASLVCLVDGDLSRSTCIQGPLDPLVVDLASLVSKDFQPFTHFDTWWYTAWLVEASNFSFTIG